MKGAQAFLQGFIFGNGYGAAASRSGGSALATLRGRATGVWVELDGAAGFGKRGWTVIQHPGAGHIGSNRKGWTARLNDDWFQFGQLVR